MSKVLQRKVLFLQNFSVFAKFFTYTCGSLIPRKNKTPARSPVAVFGIDYTLCIISHKRKNFTEEGESAAKASGKEYEKAIPGICKLCMHLTMCRSVTCLVPRFYRSAIFCIKMTFTRSISAWFSHVDKTCFTKPQVERLHHLYMRKSKRHRLRVNGILMQKTRFS